jgi:hypothetical protein
VVPPRKGSMSRFLPRLLPLMLLGLLGAEPAEAGERLVVVELFTSQGCSSCPPADALLGRLAGEENVLALSLHVDYWDYLGWRDRFARPENTRRQKAYAAMIGARSIYTPQAIVQGEDRLVGSDEVTLRAAISRQAAQPRRCVLELTPQSDHVLVRVEPDPAVGATDGGILHLVTYDQPQEILIESGENVGWKITYTNVVRDWMKIGKWDGRSTAIYAAPLPAMGRGLAVILQEGPVGRILAAARLEP